MRFARSLASIAVVTLVACSQMQSAVPPAPPAPASGAALTLRIRVPHNATRTSRYRARYVSVATKGMTVAIAGPTTIHTTVALTPGINSVALSLAPCAAKTCYTATLATYDAVTCGTTCSIPAGAHKLSANQSVAFTVVKGAHNVAGFTLGGVPSSIAVSPIHPGYVQGDAHRLQLWGPAAQRLSVLALDADGNAIVGPGAPSISANSSSTTLALTQPSATAPNVVEVRAVTSGSPAVVTPGTVSVTLTATPAAHSGALPLSLKVPVVIAHSVLYVGTSVSKLDMYYDGGTSPNAYLYGANTLLDGPNISQLAVDGNGTLYVAQSETSGQILAFPAGSSGNAAPSGNINGASTLMDHAGGIAVGNGLLNVSNATPGILGYGIGTSGNVTATNTINGSNTSLSFPFGLALDSSGALYVANSGSNSVIAFPSGSDGNPSPSITISGSNTHLQTPYAVAFGPDGSLYVSGGNGAIERFAAGANGNATPAAVISGAATTLPTYIYSLAVDANGAIYAGGGAPYVYEFAAGAHGNVAPVKSWIASGNVYGLAAVP